MRKLTVPEQHVKRIAIKTLRLSDEGAFILGGMPKQDARRFLARIGYSSKQIERMES